MRDPSQHRILIYGLDADLQKTREMLLTQAGYGVDSAEDWPTYMAYMDSYEYRLAILCHTIPKEEREECEALALGKKIQVFILNAAIAPQELMQQIAKFVYG